ncbi:uncharacterized protein LOC105168059 [Sesamum indicum]|uniref:Uncharacterized protein LOC105168059 n=1 Tax=Sesamum indicum TaxID=4182 RepID=A0A6I9TLE8_SESIN|nr:uncharacterized protein LOC105168059 [Sesamum indicum]
MAANLTIGSLDGNSGREVPQLRAHYHDGRWENFNGGGGLREIQEAQLISVFDLGNNNGGCTSGSYHLSTIREEVEESVFSFDFQERGEDVVYVAVGGNKQTSMDALIWTLNHAVLNPSSTLVFLIRVFPETKFIPSPLGMLPVSQVNPEQKEIYMAQERRKRREFLRKFLIVCSASQIKADTIVIESDTEAKAILDLIPILNIRKLVLGATKSTVRRILRSSRKGNGVADEIVQNAPEFCEVKIICEGKEMSEVMAESRSSSSTLSLRITHQTAPGSAQDQEHVDESYSCGCFNFVLIDQLQSQEHKRG